MFGHSKIGGRTLAWAAAFLCVVLAGTAAVAQGNDRGGGNGGGGNGGGGGGGGSHYTCDTFTDGAGYAVTSDGAGPYCNSEAHVSAVIGHTNGGHHLDTEKSERTLHLDFGAVGAIDTEAILSIENGSRPEGLNLLEMEVQDLNPGAPDVSARVGLGIGFDTGKKDHARLSFGRLSTIVACENPGDKVKVTRVADDSWIFESLAGEVACLSEVRNNDWENPAAIGFFEMPFRLEVTFEP